MDATGTIVTQHREAYSAEGLFRVPPHILLEQIQHQIHQTRMAINEQYKDVTVTNEMVSIVVEIIHDGVEKQVPLTNATIRSISVDDNGLGTIEVVD